MCGVAGFLLNEPMEAGSARDHAGQELLGRMVTAIAHRGPDAQGVFVDGRAGLGHARLSIVDIAAGGQPMALPEAGLTVSFNGEIFNHVELREQLVAAGCDVRTRSDTEVILHLYAVMGPDCLEHFNGDFAFALWDAPRQRLMLARDRAGVRPLYYTMRREGLYFASEIKALLQVPGVVAELDPIALDQIFTLWAPIAPRTSFKDIFELPPGHFMLADGGGRRIVPYWSPAFPDREDMDRGQDEDALAQQARELLDDATRIRLRADVPVGAYLSGGLDSSLVSALAVRHVGRRLQTFSVTFDSPEHDESAQQAVMTAALGTEHHAVACGNADIARVFPDVVRHTEAPVVRTAPAPLHMLAAHVRRNGCKVVLTGEGADEVFAGYDIFKEAAVRRFCARQPASVMRPALFRRLYPYLPGIRAQQPESLAAFFSVDGGADDSLFSHRPRMRATAAAKLFFSPALKEALAGYDAAEEMAASLPKAFARWHPLHQAQYIETTFLLPGYILSSQGDRMAMAHGVEGRFPFLDHRVMAFAASVPPGVQLKGLLEKNLLRRAARDLLPARIAARPKQPYRAPDSASFAGHGTPDYVAQALSPATIRASGLFNPAAVERLAAKCSAQGVSGFRDNTAFVGILSTQLWLEAFTGSAARGRAHPGAPLSSLA